jgi:hypothetical protein
MPTTSEQQKLKLATVLVPAIVTLVTGTLPIMFVGYLQFSGTKDDSESGYKVMVQSVKELRDVVQKQSIEIAELRGQMKGLRGSRVSVTASAECFSDADCSKGHNCKSGKCLPIPTAVDPDGIPDQPVTVAATAPPAPPEPAKKFKPLPESLEDARDFFQRAAAR